MTWDYQAMQAANPAGLDEAVEAALRLGRSLTPMEHTAALTARCARMEAALHRLAAPATAVMVEPGQGREWLVMRLRTELADRRAIAQEALRG